MPCKGYSLSVIGGREMNQDSFLVWDERGIYAVADGVGGGLRGEVASRMAVAGLKDTPVGATSLVPTIEAAQSAILTEAMESLGEPVMGTTLTAVFIDGKNALFGHVGDSRLYHFSENVLKLLTVDHEVYEESMGGTVLASYLGIASETHPLQIQEENFVVAPGDRLLLCSDGLYRQMTETRMAQLLREHLDRPQEMLNALCAEASAVSYSDNVTVVLVEVS